MGTSTAKKAQDLSPEEFTAYVNDPRFNRILPLPAASSLGRPEPLQISYADFGYHRQGSDSNIDDSEELVYLFFGPLVSSRLFGTTKDQLAKKYNIRFLNLERPGIGKTDYLPAEKLLEVWRGATAALLEHLGIKYVTIGCHSAGTVYALDFAVHYPQFLNPSRPYIALAGPWVHPSKSGVRLWSLTSSLPRSLIAQTDKVAGFFNSTLGPALGMSNAVSGSVGQLWNQTKPSMGRDGEDVQFEERIIERLARYVFTGSVRGLGQETQLLLRNGIEKDGWSDWGEIDVLVPRLAEAVRKLGGSKLKIDIFFAEKDNMIGDASSKGVQYLESCWSGVEGVDFTSEVVKGSDHETVWGLRWDTMEKVFKKMTQDLA